MHRDGGAIDGLYACGNDMQSVMGGIYPGPGITLGPAMTFGYLAGLTLAEPARADADEMANTASSSINPTRTWQ